MKIFLRIFLVSAIHVTVAFNIGQFLQGPLPIRPDLLKIVGKQANTKLNIQLHLGHDEGPKMSVSDLVVELHHEPAEYEHARLPGADGPSKSLSTGPRRLDLISEGKYVSMMGTQYIKTNRGCWEVVWRKDKPGGSLVCAFDIPQEYKRNDAILPKGNIYINIPVWTREGLKFAQEEKQRIQGELQNLLEERDENLFYFDQTENPIMKALYLRNAFAAVDQYNGADHQTLESIPTEDEVLLLQDDLLLTTRGLVWSRPDMARYILMGHAVIAPETQRKSRLMP